MGKEEIIKILEKNKGWMTAKQILAKNPECCLANIYNHLRQLSQDGDIMRSPPKRFSSFEYKYKQ